MKKILLLILNFVFIFGNIFSQSEEKYYSEKLFDSIDFNINKKDKIPLLDKNRFNYRITMGSSFMSFANTGIYSTYVAPEFNYKINKNFSFSIGLFSSFSYISSANINNEELPMNNKYRTNAGVFGKAYYLPNEKLSIYGSFAYFPSVTTDNNFSITNIGTEYKITEKFSVAAEVNIVKGNIYSIPYYGNGLNTAFRTNRYNLFSNY